MTDIATIEARIAIGEVKARYCRCLDTKDWAGYADCFTDDLELDTRPSGGAIVLGRDEAVRMVRAAIEGAATCHHVHSPEMTIAGEAAEVVWAMQDRVVWGADKRDRMGNAGFTGFGHYHERYERRDGHWRIASTTLTRLHMDVDPLPS
jgi:hypothetical protein